MTARPRSAPASGARNTICASRPMARSTKPMPRSVSCGCIPRDDPALDAQLARIQNDIFDVEADLCILVPKEGAGRRATDVTGPGGMDGTADRCAERRSGAADVVHPAGRQSRRGLPASRAHRLPARRAASWSRCAISPARKCHAAGAPVRQPAVGFPVCRRPPRQRQGRQGHPLGSPGRTAEACPRSAPQTTSARPGIAHPCLPTLS